MSIRNVNIPVNKLKDRNNTQYIPLMDQQSEKNMESSQNNNNMLQSQRNQENTQTSQSKEKQSKSVFDLIDKIITKQLNQFPEDFKQIQEIPLTKVQILMDHLAFFSEDCVNQILEETQEKQEFILKYIFKDPNEVWKYIFFLTNLIKQSDLQKSYFMKIYELFKILTEKSVEHGNIISISTRNIFNNYFC